jgi:hypothetical protein
VVCAMIKHYCDSCGKEVVRGNYATLKLYPKWRVLDGSDGF